MINIPIIDTHFHIWNASELTLEWLSGFKTIKSIYTLQEYESAIQKYNILKSCYAEVYVDRDEIDKEANYIINVCSSNQNNIVAATLGCDLTRNDFSEYIQRYNKIGYVKSVRHNFLEYNPATIIDNQFIRNTQLLGNLDIMSDLTISANFMKEAVKLVQQCPNTMFIIDHCGIYPMQGEAKLIEEWYKGITKYAAESNTICKISEPCLTAPNYHWKIEDVLLIIRHCVDSFGEDRIMYASNWPICEVTGSIELWFEALKEALKDKSDIFWHKLMHKNAEIYYQI